MILVSTTAIDSHGPLSSVAVSKNIECCCCKYSQRSLVFSGNHPTFDGVPAHLPHVIQYWITRLHHGTVILQVPHLHHLCTDIKSTNAWICSDTRGTDALKLECQLLGGPVARVAAKLIVLNWHLACLLAGTGFDKNLP